MDASNELAMMIARNAIGMGMDTDTINKLTGLIFEETESLRTSI